jgi:hypothetical protein
MSDLTGRQRALLTAEADELIAAQYFDRPQPDPADRHCG